MKTSNKILLGGFLFLILLITGIHITLYAKYKSGHYTIYSPVGNENQVAMQSFPGISHVTIHSSGAIVEFGDVLAIRKDNGNAVQYVQQGDSLVITGRTEGPWSGDVGQVKLLLPNNATVSADYANISFEKMKGNASVSSTIYLKNSTATFGFAGISSQLEHVRVNASENSSVIFRPNTAVSFLEAQLNNSTFQYDGKDIGQLSIATDSVSYLMLQSQLLPKAKITFITKNP